ncbi:NfeD family protein [Corynebacterium gerontici]|uniref:NfeD-like C-terminal domain-containing protein n=1 Tax=Corynebacterium gerontici TaxID=2079234 RepID=A0A3G6J0J9_9CORY|nr:NfeD family protein [Corynebacterium gerontici]AZA11446.1 hypothetical protein CGERO_05695 [Corynebacterium gerontici]
MGALIWIVIALALAGLELLAGELTFLMLGGGALAAAGTSMVSDSLPVQAVVFAVVSIALLGLVKPIAKKRMLQAPALDTSPRAALGQRAEVLELVDATSGQIRFDGGIWSARSLHEDERFTVGESVQVVDIDGTTAVVWKGI